MDDTGTGSASRRSTVDSTGSVNITNVQRTQIFQTFNNVNVPTIWDVGFAVSVGAVIPATVTLVDVPTEVVRIVPAWRRYKVVRVRDRIVIVDPRSRRIVTVLRA